MIKHRIGLRTKSVIALFIVCIIALIPISIIGWQVINNIQEYFSTAYLRNFTLLKKQEIVAPISRELALSLRMADSVITKEWLNDEFNSEKQDVFFREADGYRNDFEGKSYFIAIADSGNYYFVSGTAKDREVNYQLLPDVDTDTWFYSTLKSADKYNINVNYDEHLKLTKIWFNSIIRENGQALGLTGSGLDLTSFIDSFILTNETGLTPMILADNGSIQAHKDVNLIATNQTTGDNQIVLPEQTLAHHLSNDQERQALELAMQQAKNKINDVAIFPAQIDGQKQLIALSYIPDLRWYVVTAMNLKTAQYVNSNWLRSGLILLALLIIILSMGFAYAVSKIIIKPIKNLQEAAIEFTNGNYDYKLPLIKNDEIGDLTKSFSIMSKQVRDQMVLLEDKVAQRTQELSLANQEMTKAYDKINDSIKYASLIQDALLPDQQLKQLLGGAYCLIWRPRDIVGGDLYVFHQQNNKYLIGLIDCAGHGVPGAMMTMLAKAALDHAIEKADINKPSTILQAFDNNMRAILQERDLSSAIATRIDAGMVCIDTDNHKLIYSGAKINLYCCDGITVEEIKSNYRAIGDRKKGVYTDHELDIGNNVTYTLTTDGLLDQAGGPKGYSFGSKRFNDLLIYSANHDISEQANIFENTLKEYCGEYAQRDDITVISFRFNHKINKHEQD